MNRSLGALLTFGLCVGALGPAGHAAAQSAPQPTKNRLIVLTDIGADPDDSESMVRLLLYSNDIQIEGVVVGTSTWQRTRIAPELAYRTIDAYAKVHGNLIAHDSRYPTAAALRALVKRGLPVYGMQGVGEGKDSEGSDWIIHVLDNPDERPVWVSVWGGPYTLAQALWKIQHTRTPAEAERLYRKLRVYTISDQDDSGPWIRRTFPSVFYIVSPGDYGRSVWQAIGELSPATNNELISNRWLAENIQQGHGPLGRVYPDVAWIMEGDTPSFLGLIPNGLSAPEHPNWGGWGGRYELYTPEPTPPSNNVAEPGKEKVPVAETRPIWTNAAEAVSPVVAGTYGRALRPDSVVYRGDRMGLLRWRDDFQNDLAARMDWTVKKVAEANHPPVPRLAHPDTLTVRSGQSFHVDACGSSDPDGDSISLIWFVYREAGTYSGPFDFVPPNQCREDLRAPQVDAPRTIHLILRVTDKGTPPLTRYRRVIVTVTP